MIDAPDYAKTVQMSPKTWVP